MEKYVLPHGAKGIEGDDFVVAFGGDKIVFVAKSGGKGKHYMYGSGRIKRRKQVRQSC